MTKLRHRITTLRLSSLILAIIALIFYPAAVEADGGIVMYSPYPGSAPMSDYINQNYPGQDGAGMHWDGANIPGVDTLGPDLRYYLPIEICPSQGDYIRTLVDDVGTGGNGLVFLKNTSEGQIKGMSWHYEGFDSEFEAMIASGECIPAKTLVGTEGETLSSGGMLTTFTAMGWKGQNKHAHTSWGKSTPWNNGCQEVAMSEYYWINPTCIAVTWEEGPQNEPDQVEQTLRELSQIASDTNSYQDSNQALNNAGGDASTESGNTYNGGGLDQSVVRNSTSSDSASFQVAKKTTKLVQPQLKYSEVNQPHMPAFTVMENGWLAIDVEGAPVKQDPRVALQSYLRKKLIQESYWKPALAVLIVLLIVVVVKPKKTVIIVRHRKRR